MKLATAIVAGMLLALPAVRANAAPVDCEAARCTVQAAIDEECPCAEAKNHSRYTACVSRIVNRLAREGTLPKKCRSKIEGCAIRSTCGKRDGTVACQLPGSAVTSRCRPLSSAAMCTIRGGTVVASCCASCTAPEPTATVTTTPVPTVTETAAPAATTTSTPVPVATDTPLPTITEVPVATTTATPEPTATAVAPTATAVAPTATAVAPTATAVAPTATAVAPTATAVAPTATAVAPTATAVAPTATAVAPTATAVAPTATAVVPTATPTDVPTATVTVTATRTATPTTTPVPTNTATLTPTPGPTPFCGDGIVNGTEQCDFNAPDSCANVAPNGAGNGLEACSLSCTCACPTKLTFSGDAADPLSLLDTGWTGISHRAPVISNGDVTVNVNCVATQRPCGTCTLSGPAPNDLAGQLNDHRCSNDTSIKCTSNTPCVAGGGTCEYYFGSPLPLAAGGVTTCVVNQFFGPISGTANVESGGANTIVTLRSQVFNGLAIDNPCPRCVGDTTDNDGVNDGTCDGGPRQGLGCDGGGNIPGRADFGTTSLDCPPSTNAMIATLPIDLSSKTAPVTKTLTASNANCTGSAGDKCLCDTCNTANAEPCSTNADCPTSGGAAGICGGRRCLSGANNGAPCTTGTQCPGGACARTGEPTKPSSCTDDTTIDDRVIECADADGDGEGQCTIGPTDQNCSAASGHGQRGCSSDADCGGAPGSCLSIARRCFLTGGGTFQPSGKNDGSDTLTAVGVADVPMNDTSHPTLGAVFCVGPTSAPAVNNVAGLPGPGRVTIKGTARGLP